MYLFLIIFLIGIFNGFINVTVGGGGLVNTPLLLALGVNAYATLATTKFITIGSGITGGARYQRAHIFTNRGFVFILIVLCLIGGVIGANITFLIDELMLKWIIIVLSVIVLFLTVLKKEPVESEKVTHSSKMQYVVSFISIFLISIYGGSIGMGAGIAVLAILVHYIKFPYVQSSALMTLFTLALTISSAAIFMMKGAINYEYGVPLFIGSAIGGWMGAHMAVKKGSKLIKTMTIVISVVLIGKVLIDLL